MESLSDQNLDLINVAIHRIIEERKSGHDKVPFLVPGSDDDHLLLSKLLSQLESLKGDSATNPPDESSLGTKDMSSGASVVAVNPGEKAEGMTSVETDEIVKELKEVKKQNTLTHWLLSIMIVLTLTWQVSEVSLMLKVKDGLSHPFRSVGGMLTGMFKGRATNGKDGEDSLVSSQSESLPFPPMMTPELPKFADLGLKNEKE